MSKSLKRITKWFVGIITLWILLVPASITYASSIKGTSLGEVSGCDYYAIEDSGGDYTVAEWYGGITPYEGDAVVGELHSYGFKDIYDINRDSSTHVWIEDWLLSEDRAMEILVDKCDWSSQLKTYFDGYDSYNASTYTYQPATPTCPANSTYSGGLCTCNTGYKVSGSVCVTSTQACQNKYGANSYGDDQNCYCSQGFQWDTGKTTCVKTYTCPAGYIINSSNQCITYTESCQIVNNSDANIIGSLDTNGKVQCSCGNGYMWDGKQCSRVTPQTTAASQTPVPTNSTTLELQKPSSKPKIAAAPTKKIETKISTSSSTEVRQTASSSTTTPIEPEKTSPSWLVKVWKFIWRF